MLDNRSSIGWNRLGETPYYFFYYYVPVRYGMVSRESQDVRRLIWNFKEGRNQDGIISMLKKKLRSEFGDLSSLAFACIPASTREKNNMRYRRFSDELCSSLNMKNAFSHISIVKEKEPKHLGGQSFATYDFDKEFFRGKKVILFDDVVTRGSSMHSFISYLDESGAKTVCCISIGRTYWDRIMPDSIQNPWTGEYVFFGPTDNRIVIEIAIDDKTKGENDEHPAQPADDTKKLPDIMDAIARNKVEDVRAYIQGDGDLEIRDRFDRTPLTKAVIAGNLDIVRLLVENSADIEYRWNGVTPTYLSAQNDYREIFAYLCENGASIDVTDDTGMSIRELCTKRGHKDIISILNTYDKKYSSNVSSSMHYNVGDAVTIGRYQGRVLHWRIIDKDTINGRYLVITKFGIECMKFCESRQFVSWEKSAIRRWLNGDFYDSTFSEIEKNRILTSEYVATDNPIYRSNQGIDTSDKVSILNITEYNKYFDLYNKWECRLFSGIMRQCWLRNSGNDNCHAAFIGRSGSIHAGGSFVDSPRNAVRPIMWVQL